MYVERLRTRPRTRLLRDVALFRSCTQSELRRIDSIATQIRVEKGRVLTHAGEPGLEFFVILSGSATVWREGIQLDAIGPGSFFGELSLLDDGVRTATVIAASDMDLLVLSRKEFLSSQFLARPVMERMLATMSQRLRRADRGWTDNTTVTVTAGRPR
jgi:CRP/FNR family transcriptional regulator, cyclic AMP receptor protein